ncbi:unnamed protein product [Amoebophrya sp. A120]|nr:unnamed protein product [Amoebophrya sp. A120]|eukprot:GSA120T00008255001.1
MFLSRHWGKPVEVKKSDTATTWYQAVLVGDGKNGEAARVRFPYEIFPFDAIAQASAAASGYGGLKNRDVILNPTALAGNGQPGSSVSKTTLCAYDAENVLWAEKLVFVKQCCRERQRPTAASNWEPSVNELVELSFEANKYYPAGWALGRVTGTKDEFYFVRFEVDESSGFTKDQKTVIVKKDVLRRLPALPDGMMSGKNQIISSATGAPALGGPAASSSRLTSSQQMLNYSRSICPEGRFSKKICELPDPEDLHSLWLFTPDAVEILSQLKRKLELVLIVPSPEVSFGAMTGEQREQSTAEIALFAAGDNERSLKNLEQAELLLQIHWHHQTKIQAFTREREKKLKELEALKEKLDRGTAMHREISEKVVGKLIGKNGKNIARLQEKYGVEIKVADKKPTKATAATLVEVEHEQVEEEDEQVAAEPATAQDDTKINGTSSSTTPKGGRSNKNNSAVKNKPATSSATRKITIFGIDKDAVKQAWEETDLAISEMKLTQDQCKFLRQKCQFSELMQETGASFIGFGSKESTTLEVIGKEIEVEEAKLILEGHLLYYSSYQSMNEAKETLRTEEEKFQQEYGRAGGKGKRKGRKSAKDANDNNEAGADNSDKQKKGSSKGGKGGKNANKNNKSKPDKHEKDKREKSENKDKRTKPDHAAAPNEKNTKPEIAPNPNEPSTTSSPDLKTNKPSSPSPKSKGGAKRKGSVDSVVETATAAEAAAPAATVGGD